MTLADRLVEQYKKHGKLIIAFDFDDTVFPYSHQVDTPITRRTRKVLRMAKEQGHTLVCFTCRGSIADVKMYCDFKKISFDYFNDCPLKLGNGKIFYNILLDDKAGLREALTELETALYTIKGTQ
jgi:hydroxymethylpyrimidine pyrophosphatase-like HAD family hydrolase